MKNVLVIITFLLVAYSFCSCSKEDDGPITPQTQNEITGSVKDESGRPYPNSKVKLFNQTQALEATTKTDGSYGFNLNNNGNYTITITLPLSATLVSEDSIEVDVEVDVEKTVNFIIKPQPLAALTVKGNIDIFGELRNEAGMVPTQANELIYARNVFDPPIGMLTPIKAPNGDHLVLSEWETALGSIVTHCNGNTSEVAITLQGMIPDGVYTFWLNFLNKKKSPGEFVSLANDLAYIEPLGSGSLNVVQAGSNGVLTASINHASCVLTQEPALILVVVYHLNGNTFGSGHIPDEEDVSYLLVYFQ